MFKCDGYISEADLKDIFDKILTCDDQSDAKIALGYIIDQLIKSSRDVLNMDRKYFMQSVNYEYDFIEWEDNNVSKETKKSINRI